MPDPRFAYLYEGEVTRRDDPDGLGRIKIRIDGLIEPETPGWAWPMGNPCSGAAGFGTWEPPVIGATVGVLFKMGEPDHPFYLTGPWGAPNGTSDVPTDAEVDTDDSGKSTRHNAVIEDEEWTIQRDSRIAGSKYLIKHKLSETTILIDGSADEIHLVRNDSDQQYILGTDYRAEEAQLFSDIRTNLIEAGVQLNTAGTDPTLSGLAPLAATAIVSAGTALTSAATVIGNSDIINATEFLSDKLFGE